MSKNEKDLRTKRVEIRMTEEEKALIQKYADDHFLTIAQAIRTLCLNGIRQLEE